MKFYFINFFSQKICAIMHAISLFYLLLMWVICVSDDDFH